MSTTTGPNPMIGYKFIILLLPWLYRYIRAVGYRWLARWLFGYIGPDNTRPLAACIYENLRRRYDTGGTTGYIDAEKRS